MSTGAKVFLWIAGILAVAAVVGAAFYLVLSAGSSPSPDRNPIFGYNKPFDGYDDEDKGEKRMMRSPLPPRSLPRRSPSAPR